MTRAEAESMITFIKAFQKRNEGKDIAIINHLFKIEFNTFLDDNKFEKEIINHFKIN